MDGLSQRQVAKQFSTHGISAVPRSLCHIRSPLQPRKGREISTRIARRHTRRRTRCSMQSRGSRRVATHDTPTTPDAAMYALGMACADAAVCCSPPWPTMCPRCRRRLRCAYHARCSYVCSACPLLWHAVAGQPPCHHCDGAHDELTMPDAAILCARHVRRCAADAAVCSPPSPTMCPA